MPSHGLRLPKAPIAIRGIVALWARILNWPSRFVDGSLVLQEWNVGIRQRRDSRPKFQKKTNTCFASGKDDCDPEAGFANLRSWRSTGGVSQPT